GRLRRRRRRGVGTGRGGTGRGGRTRRDSGRVRIGHSGRRRDTHLPRSGPALTVRILRPLLVSTLLRELILGPPLKLVPIVCPGPESDVTTRFPDVQSVRIGHSGRGRDIDEFFGDVLRNEPVRLV